MGRRREKTARQNRGKNRSRISLWSDCNSSPTYAFSKSIVHEGASKGLTFIRIERGRRLDKRRREAEKL